MTKVEQQNEVTYSKDTAWNIVRYGIRHLLETTSGSIESVEIAARWHYHVPRENAQTTADGSGFLDYVEKIR